MDFNKNFVNPVLNVPNPAKLQQWEQQVVHFGHFEGI